MDTTSALKFVKGAVAGANSLLTEMTHYAIEGGAVRSFNGIMCLSSPIDFPFDCNPKADKFGVALSRCDSDVMSLHMTDTGRVRVMSGGFKAFVETIDGPVPHPKPSGATVEVDGDLLLKAFQGLLPFIGTDASRPWSNGILFRGSSAFATNNVVIAQHWINATFPEFNVPFQAVKEVIRIKEPPISVQHDMNSITFHYGEGRWLRSQLLDLGWPDVEGLLARCWDSCDMISLHEEFFPGLEAIKPFVEANNWVYVRNGGVYTTHCDDIGASYEVPGLEVEGAYNIKMLLLLKDTATHADFKKYPNPVPWAGGAVRGLIVGYSV